MYCLYILHYTYIYNLQTTDIHIQHIYSGYTTYILPIYYPVAIDKLPIAYVIYVYSPIYILPINKVLPYNPHPDPGDKSY